ncbi:MAG: hypothetical protein HZA90_16775 [Verrucomicrobia bacterium]|nr:hypothetical protein [Verrucomicrobiota bacterium]
MAPGAAPGWELRGSASLPGGFLRLTPDYSYMQWGNAFYTARTFNSESFIFMAEINVGGPGTLADGITFSWVDSTKVLAGQGTLNGYSGGSLGMPDVADGYAFALRSRPGTPPQTGLFRTSRDILFPPSVQDLTYQNVGWLPVRLICMGGNFAFEWGVGYPNRFTFTIPQGPDRAEFQAYNQAWFGVTGATGSSTEYHWIRNVRLDAIPSVPPNQPPVALCGDVIVLAGQDCMAIASIDSGSFDPDGDIITIAQDPPGPYSLGTTPVNLTVTDSQGASTTCQATVTVVDTTPPTPNVDPLPLVEGEGSVSVTTIPTATDNCAGTVMATTSDPLEYTVPGTYTITWTYNDGNGNTSSQSQQVTVTEAPGDIEPPVIGSITANPKVLWPANHKMVPVTITVVAQDNTPGPLTARILSVTSNESENGLGDGDTAPDWQINNGLTVDLRAERSGNGSGRIYTITVQVSDAAGNTAFGTVTVTVPKSQGK